MGEVLYFSNTLKCVLRVPKKWLTWYDVNLMQPRVTKKEYLKDGLSTLCLPLVCLYEMS